MQNFLKFVNPFHIGTIDAESKYSHTKFIQAMRRILLLSVLLFLPFYSYCQQTSTSIYQKGISAYENLQAIGNLSPYSPGGVGFDTRYQGVKGSPRLLDTLLQSYLRIGGREDYFELLADLDLVSNSVIYEHPKTKKLFAVPLDVISEVIINKDGKELVFRSTMGKRFDRDLREQKFYQVLNDGKFQFIKIPVKTFIQANYKGAYSADRPYDEFQSDAKYYLMNSDGIFCQIQLNKKSVAKIYPEKKKLIDQLARDEANTDKEAMILSILDKF
ncbi:MAG TPA: hypothetical protein DCZ51_05000 [Bacteroidales bacterium]|nr:hypothetical protein [Bacteroidales bacterium]